MQYATFIGCCSSHPQPRSNKEISKHSDFMSINWPLYLHKSVSAVGGLLWAQRFAHTLTFGRDGAIGQTLRQQRLLDLQKTDKWCQHLILKNDDQLITLYRQEVTTKCSPPVMTLRCWSVLTCWHHWFPSCFLCWLVGIWGQHVTTATTNTVVLQKNSVTSSGV